MRFPLFPSDRYEIFSNDLTSPLSTHGWCQKPYQILTKFCNVIMALLWEVHYTLGNKTSKTNSTYVEMVESFFKSWSKGQRTPIQSWPWLNFESSSIQPFARRQYIWSLWRRRHLEFVDPLTKWTCIYSFPTTSSSLDPYLKLWISD